MQNKVNQGLQSFILDQGTLLKEGDLQLFLSPSDIGVQENKGRLGSRFAPQAIMAVFLKLNDSEISQRVFHHSLTSQLRDLDDYSGAIDQSVEEFKKNFSSKNPLVHLGGGHDHIYSLLKGLYDLGEKNLLILNIDPHCDTRIDEKPHSGNPFRRFVQNCPGWNGKLIQVGISEMNNNKETLRGVSNMDIFNFEQLRVLSENFSKDLSLNDFITQKTIEVCDRVIISIDADVIESSVMEAVSAVSYKGIPAHYLRSLMVSLLRGIKKPHALGIYEYNPLYDNLSNKGSRYLAGLIYDYWKQSLILN